MGGGAGEKAANSSLSKQLLCITSGSNVWKDVNNWVYWVATVHEQNDTFGDTNLVFEVKVIWAHKTTSNAILRPELSLGWLVN